MGCVSPLQARPWLRTHLARILTLTHVIHPVYVCTGTRLPSLSSFFGHSLVWGILPNCFCLDVMLKENEFLLFHAPDFLLSVSSLRFLASTVKVIHVRDIRGLLAQNRGVGVLDTD